MREPPPTTADPPTAQRIATGLVELVLGSLLAGPIRLDSLFLFIVMMGKAKN